MSASAAKGSTAVSRSVYVAQLRRAFLLRAHPDRFRNSDDQTRRGQAVLLQALSERWNAQDFQDYTANIASSSNSILMARSSFATTNKQQQTLPYVLQKRDGSLLKQVIRLDDSVENVLKNLSQALELSGAASLPGPPPPAPKAEHMIGLDADAIYWASTASTPTMDRFDINTQRGRDLLAFLKATPASEIEERRAFRMDASTAALVARRLFSFQAIDGVSMGWSSESFAVLLRSLIRLHEEHASRFHVESFYPLRLVFARDDFHAALDVYGGILYLHPAATNVQMLEALQSVTTSRLEELQTNRGLLQQRAAQLQLELGVKITKGYSCSSVEYHAFLHRIVHDPSFPSGESNSKGLVTTTSSLELDRVRLVVESPSACRRARLTKEGYIQTHALMTLTDLRLAKSRLAEQSQRRLAEQRKEEQRCKDAVQQIQWAIGVQKVTRKGLVSHTEFLASLSRLLEQRDTLRSRMAGNSLTIAASGHFCHLDDDGSFVIPHDWT